MIVRRIAEYLQENDGYLVVSHARPDGDAIGSILAIGLALRALGKKVEIIGSDPVPRDYRTLPGAQTLLRCPRAPEGYGTAVIMECSSVGRTGVEGLEGRYLINIDHHASATEYAQLNWIDTSFGAVGQLAFRLIETLGVPVTPDIATNLYVALVTDTGNFQFGNTTEVEFQDAARLVRLGVQPADIAGRIYHNNSLPRVRLLGEVLRTLETDETRRIAWVCMSRELLQRAGALPEDTEGIINHLLTIENIRLAAFFKEESAGSYKLSLRSKGDLDVAQIAQSYQGGGHKNAAGFTVHADLDSAKRQVLERLRALLNHQPD